eukprot:5549115-Pyramimonas_sp.AAC.1
MRRCRANSFLRAAHVSSRLNRFDSSTTPFAVMSRSLQPPRATLAPFFALWPPTWLRFKCPVSQ